MSGVPQPTVRRTRYREGLSRMVTPSVQVTGRSLRSARRTPIDDLRTETLDLRRTLENGGTDPTDPDISVVAGDVNATRSAQDSALRGEV